MNAARALFVAALLAAPAAQAGNDYDALFQRYGAAYDIDWRLLKAVAQVESDLNARAENRADPSVGLNGHPSGRRGITPAVRAGWPTRRAERQCKAAIEQHSEGIPEILMIAYAGAVYEA